MRVGDKRRITIPPSMGYEIGPMSLMPSRVLWMSLISLFSCFFHCYADTETSALGQYHKIHGLYLMLSWLVLAATNFKKSAGMLCSGLIRVRKMLMRIIHLPFFGIGFYLSSMQKRLELKFCRKL